MSDIQTKSGGIFLIIKPKDDKASGFKDHHFAVEATVKECVGAIEDATIDTKTGNYVIKVKTEGQANKLSKVKKLKDGFKIKVERHGKLNSSKAVIRCKHVTGTEDATLLQQLSKQNVIGVKSIPPDHKTKILTFRVATPPETINIGLLKVKTQTYYPLPKTCRKCKRLGHITDNCKGTQRCENCSERHEQSKCTNMAHCINCKGKHKTSDKTCPAYKQEKDIIRAQTNLNISPKEARRRYKETHKEEYYPIQKDDEHEQELDESSGSEQNSKMKPVELSDSEGEVELVGVDALGHPPTIPQPIKEELKTPPTRNPNKAKKTPDESDGGPSTKKPERKRKKKGKSPRATKQMLLQEKLLEMAEKELSRNDEQTEEDSDE